MKQFLLFICLASLLSCSVQKQGQRKAAWLLSHDLLDDYCARIYPAKDSAGVVKIDTVHADNSAQAALIDSLKADLDSVTQKAAADLFRAEQGHEECLQVVDEQSAAFSKLKTGYQRLEKLFLNVQPSVITKTETIYRTDEAEVQRLKGVILEKDKQVTEAQKQASVWSEKAAKGDKWKFYFIALAVMNLLALIFRLLIIKRPI